MVADPYFQAYAAINRVSQELLWLSVIESVDRQRTALAATAASLRGKHGRCLLRDGFQTPTYVTALDIHCMPGGYAPGGRPADDFTAGALYDRGVYLYGMGYSGPLCDDKGRSVANYLRRRLAEFHPKRILDMGCTVGHSTLPYKELFPDAEVIGIDVAAPQLLYAHLRACGLGVEVAFEQQNAERTDFADASFDLVVSHILLHETSAKAMPAIFRECHRLLAPGGYMIHADLPPFDRMNEFSKFILDNETYYNNEPFWGVMREIDQVALAVEAGFPRESVRFDTAPMSVRELAGRARGYDVASVGEVAGRSFKAGEYAPGGGWEVLIARKEPAS
jgi:SAM-dependent methyltransferase